MFSGIGIFEVLIIIVVILVVLGPQRVPELARKLGQAVRAIRRASADLSVAVTRELDATEEKPAKKSPPSSAGETPAPTPPPSAGKTAQANSDNPPGKTGEAPKST
jgi:sec-independent protein translocase protein TatA